MQIRGRAKAATRDLKKSPVDFGGMDGYTVRVVTEKKSRGATEGTRFDDGLEAAGANEIEKNELSEASTIERAAPGVETFWFEVVFHSADKGLGQVVFQPGFERICHSQFPFKCCTRQTAPQTTMPTTPSGRRD